MQATSILAGGPDHGNGDEAVRDPLVELVLRPRGGLASKVDGGTDSCADVLEEGAVAPLLRGQGSLLGGLAQSFQLLFYYLSYFLAVSLFCTISFLLF